MGRLAHGVEGIAGAGRDASASFADWAGVGGLAVAVADGEQGERGGCGDDDAEWVHIHITGIWALF